MDDLRQKLFPIFLGESERNLEALRKFLAYEDLAEATAEELETAFRAAHTLKGTAKLVEAESICTIARRLEAMLEKHFEAGTRPTPVEHEALKLAVDWLAPLVSALQGNLEEPKFFVAEALQALDLAEAFPGRTPLVELLDSKAEQRAPQLDDPFSSDPNLLADEEEILQAERDPFATDPGFGKPLERAENSEGLLTKGKPEPLADDPFAEDYDFLAEESLATASAAAESGEESQELPYDPFADDALDLDVDGLPQTDAGGEVEELSSVQSEVDDEDTVADDLSVESVAELTADPFADDEDFIVDAATTETQEEREVVTVEDTDDRSLDEVAADDQVGEEGEPDTYSATDSVAARAEEIAESLLLPHDESAPRKEYSCCVFAIGGRDYHLPIKQMLEIADLPQVLPLPLSPPMVRGLINLRGQVLPVINLAVLNQHQQTEVRVQRRLVVAEHKQETLAFLADGVPYLSEDVNGEKVDMSQFLSLYRIRGAE